MAHLARTLPATRTGDTAINDNACVHYLPHHDLIPGRPEFVVYDFATGRDITGADRRTALERARAAIDAELGDSPDVTPGTAGTGQRPDGVAAGELPRNRELPDRLELDLLDACAYFIRRNAHLATGTQLNTVNRWLTARDRD